MEKSQRTLFYISHEYNAEDIRYLQLMHTSNHAIVWESLGWNEQHAKQILSIVAGETDDCGLKKIPVSPFEQSVVALLRNTKKPLFFAGFPENSDFYTQWKKHTQTISDLLTGAEPFTQIQAHWFDLLQERRRLNTQRMARYFEVLQATPARMDSFTEDPELKVLAFFSPELQDVQKLARNAQLKFNSFDAGVPRVYRSAFAYTVTLESEKITEHDLARSLAFVVLESKLRFPGVAAYNYRTGVANLIINKCRQEQLVGLIDMRGKATEADYIRYLHANNLPYAETDQEVHVIVRRELYALAHERRPPKAVVDIDLTFLFAFHTNQADAIGFPRLLKAADIFLPESNAWTPDLKLSYQKIADGTISDFSDVIENEHRKHYAKSDFFEYQLLELVGTGKGVGIADIPSTDPMDYKIFLNRSELHVSHMRYIDFNAFITAFKDELDFNTKAHDHREQSYIDTLFAEIYRVIKERKIQHRPVRVLATMGAAHLNLYRELIASGFPCKAFTNFPPTWLYPQIFWDNYISGKEVTTDAALREWFVRLSGSAMKPTFKVMDAEVWAYNRMLAESLSFSEMQYLFEQSGLGKLASPEYYGHISDPPSPVMKLLKQKGFKLPTSRKALLQILDKHYGTKSGKELYKLPENV